MIMRSRAIMRMSAHCIVSIGVVEVEDADASIMRAADNSPEEMPRPRPVGWLGYHCISGTAVAQENNAVTLPIGST